MARLRAPFLMVLVLAAALAGCAQRDEGADPAGATTREQVAFGDVHGLAVHPQRPEELYVATHHGLFRAVRDADWSRVGAGTDDLMGFTMSARDGDTVWSSGHPKDRSAGSNLGVRISRDAGATWEPRGLSGVDCHAMASSPADPDRLWCVERGMLHASRDGGATWGMGSTKLPQSTFSIAPHPERVDTLYGATASGIMVSESGGAAWRHLAREAPVHALAINPKDAREMVLLDRAGAARSSDAGATWTRLSYDPAGGTPAHVAINPADPRVIYVATYEGAIQKSADGGETWTLLHAAPAR